MATYKKVSALSAASALAGTEAVLAVQTNTSVYTTPAQIATYVHANPAGITATSVITGEYLFTEDNELDYSASIVDAMSAATVTFSELPSTTVAVLAYYDLEETGTTVGVTLKRSAGGTAVFGVRAIFADVGTNALRGTAWLPTNANSIYVSSVAADAASTFKILGYKTGA